MKGGGRDKTDIKLIEKSEESTLRDLVKTEFSAPRHLLYLELGVTPARYVVKKRKIMYLKNILNSQDNSLLKETYDAQIKSPVRGDWATEIKQILQKI